MTAQVCLQDITKECTTYVPFKKKFSRNNYLSTMSECLQQGIIAT